MVVWFIHNFSFVIVNMSFTKKAIQIYLAPQNSRTLKAQAAFEGLSTSELAENMILHCLNDTDLFDRLVAKCHAAKLSAK